MAGLLRKSMLYLGLVDDEHPDAYAHDRHGYYAEDEADEGYDAGYGPGAAPGYGYEAPVAAPRGPVATRAAVPARAEATARALREPLAEPERRPRPAAGYQITTLQPRTYNEARTIGEHFRAGTVVIINLTEMDDADAKRLVDFSAGLIFGLHGSIERVTNKVFLLSPANILVSAEDKARMAEHGFFNQS